MKKSIRKITILFLSLVLIINASFFTLQAKNNKRIKTKEEVYAENLEKIKEYNDLSKEDLAKKNGITVEKLDEVKKLNSKIGKTVKIDAFLRTVACPYCKDGRLIHLGNKCLYWHTTGNQRRCDDNYAYGYDVEYKRLCQATKKCDRCGYEYSTEWEETYWKCFGNNDPGRI